MSEVITARGIWNAQEPKEFEQARAEALTGDKVGFKVEWLTNIEDPNREGANWRAPRMIGQSYDEAWRSQCQWLADKIIGEPKEMLQHTTESLIAMGIVGVYRKSVPVELRGRAVDELLGEDSPLREPKPLGDWARMPPTEYPEHRE